MCVFVKATQILKISFLLAFYATNQDNKPILDIFFIFIKTEDYQMQTIVINIS